MPTLNLSGRALSSVLFFSPLHFVTTLEENNIPLGISNTRGIREGIFLRAMIVDTDAKELETI